MGDYYWYGCEGQQDSDIAANYYAQAALKDDPQVSLTLSYMVDSLTWI